MSNFSALNAVGLTLRNLLLDRMEFTPNNLVITINTPFSENNQAPPAAGPTPEAERINLFLYQVSNNQFLSNQDLPSNRGSQGSPPLSLNLHYLVTAYGSTVISTGAFLDESRAQMLLGSAMRVLHDHALINDRLVTTRLTPLGQTILHAALRGEYELIKISLDPVSIEDLTKLWTSLASPYRLSAAYSVSVVQIESQRARRFPGLVGEPPSAGPHVTVLPLQVPSIQSLAVHAATDPPGVEHPIPALHIGDTLIITGLNFGLDTVLVALNELEIPIRPISNQRIEIVIPDSSYTFQGVVTQIQANQQLQPGALAVAVKVIPANLPQAAVSSNQAVALLTPFVQTITPLPAAQPTTLRLNGTRLYAADLRSEALIGRFLIPSSAYLTPTSTQIDLPLPLQLPFKGWRIFTGQTLAAFPNLAGSLPSLNVTIGGVIYTGANAVTLRTSPTSFVEAALALEDALHRVANREPEFTQARVIPFSSAATNNGLVIIPGILNAAVAIQNTSAAAQLGLGTLSERPGYFSGALDPFPKLSTPPGQIQVTFNTSRTISLAAAPLSVEDAALKIQAALNAAPGPAFTQARVFVVGSQLLVVRGTTGPITIDVVPGVDTTTAAELQFKASYFVRVRVNGAEGLGGANQAALPV